MTDKNSDGWWKAVQVHAAAHVIGAIVFAALALGAGLALGGIVKAPDRCEGVRIEFAAREHFRRA